MVTGGGGQRKGKLGEGEQKVQNSINSYKINIRDIMYNMISITDTAICYT